ncbi:MAG: hypothetical protein QM581_12900, partial [Pseudomonas sp.]
MLLLLARLLLYMPEPRPVPRVESTMRVTLLAREPLLPAAQQAARMPPRSAAPAHRAGQSAPRA